MEEWHQKLHNNTSPDDVVICEALIAYIRAGLDIQAYWDTLHVSASAACISSIPMNCRGLLRNGLSVGVQDKHAGFQGSASVPLEFCMLHICTLLHHYHHAAACLTWCLSSARLPT